MKKIILSISSIIFSVAMISGGTGAFLGDSTTSTENTFVSGVVELKIDNESYVTDNFSKLVFSPTTSWAFSSLPGKLFFNFLDVKPGDIGEDTISMHVNNNNAWACMNIKMTATPENGITEPEGLLDSTTGLNQGELQDNLYFIFWADDGDNVFENNETVWKQGLSKDIFNGQNWTLADSQTNVWGGPGPLLGNTIKYIGKAWCFGKITQTPPTQDNQGKTGTNGPLVRGTGFKCEGKDVGNIVQSDGIKADINFSVVQSRNNDSFICGNDTGGTCDSSVNLVQNGGFEAPVVPFGQFSYVSSSNPLLKWMVAWVNPLIGGTPLLEIHNHFDGGDPFEGNQHVELGSEHSTTIWQNINTIPGKQYSITFKYSPRPYINDNNIQVKVDGAILGANINSSGASNTNTVWQSITRTFIATNSTTRVEFFDNSIDDKWGGYIDNVSVSCTGTPIVTNIPPISNAGPDQTITLPTNFVTLSGGTSSDPDGTIVSYAWTQISGPANIDPADVASPNISGLVAGMYIFQLLVTDNNGATSTDIVTIVVNSFGGGIILNQYCSSSYWKNSSNFSNWVGYSPNQDFSTAFDNAFPGKTLLQVLENNDTGLGSLNRLGREAVIALLNAGKVNYPYSQFQVISLFNATYPGFNSSYKILSNTFALPENCPL